MKVLKFGGSSILSPEQIVDGKKIVESQQESCVVVFSAFQGVTDSLVKLANSAMQRNTSYLEELYSIENRHIDTVKKLIHGKKQEEVMIRVNQVVKELEDILKGIFLLRELSPKTLDLILSFGEQLSSYILSNIIDNAVLYDARKFILTNANYGSARVDFEQTNSLIMNQFAVIDH